MLLNRSRICVLIGLPLILMGCGDNSSDYRPLAESPTESSSGKDSHSTTESTASSARPRQSEQKGSRSEALPDGSASQAARDTSDTKSSPLGKSPSSTALPTVTASGLSPSPETASTPGSGSSQPDETTAPSRSMAKDATATPQTPSADEKTLVPGGNRGMLNPPSRSATRPQEIKLLIPHKEFVREGKNQSWRITFDDLDLLKVCNMEPVPPDVMKYLPDWLKNLNGQKIILRGWMFPSGRQEGISSFMFVRDNGICCFGRDPKVYDKLAVTMQPGKTTSYIAGRPFDVEATLFIEPDIEGTEEGLWWLYRLEDARVIDQ